MDLRKLNGLLDSDIARFGKGIFAFGTGQLVTYTESDVWVINQNRASCNKLPCK